MGAKTVKGQCYCGAVQLEAALPPRFVAHCHCENCRRAHGAAFVTWAGFKKDQVHLVSGDTALTRYVTDTSAIRSFCRSCGTTLLFESPRWEGEVHVTLANLHGDVGKAPGGHAYADRAVAWCPITDDLPRYGGQSGTEPLD